MSTKKTNTRVVVNTCILVLMSVIFGALTICGINKIQNVSKNFQSISNAPALCFGDIHTDEQGYKTLDNAYICAKSDGSSKAELSEQSLFIYDKMTQSSITRSADLVIVLSVLGSILTVGGLFGAIVYWNHNRN